jgi:moderate conductance mechanosensitive channel
VNALIGINTIGLGEIVGQPGDGIRQTWCVLAQEQIDNTIEGWLTRPLFALAVILGAVVVSRLIRLTILATLRYLARRSLTHPTRWWRARLPRTLGESREQAEDRRRQRIEATGRMLGHLISIVLYLGAGIAALHLVGIDPLVLLTSAGFIGAGLAFGGQNLVKDYLAGLTVLLEDRYGPGDHITVTLDGTELEGVVDHVGAFSTRLSDGTTTWHLANTSLANMRNHDQSPATTELTIAARPARDRKTLTDDVASAVERAAASPLTPGVILVDEVETDIEATGEHPVVRVSVRTPRPMSEHEQERLRRVVEAELAERQRPRRPPADDPR